MKYEFLKKVTGPEDYSFKYSICTFTTRIEEYKEMVESFIQAGFSTAECEFLYIDNTNHNSIDAYQGIGFFLRTAKGKHIIICHQDVLINKDKAEDLDKRLAELQELDNNWAICGNAGAVGPNYVVYHISYPNDVFKSKGQFPLRVSALDENFLVIKNSASVMTSAKLSGFHLYATDLCLNADIMGYTSYVIAFNLTHKSYGNADSSFQQSRKELIKRYDHSFRSRWIQTNSTVFYLSGSMLGKLMGNPISLFLVRMLNGIKKRRK